MTIKYGWNDDKWTEGAICTYCNIRDSLIKSLLLVIARVSLVITE